MADWYLVRHGETRWNAEQRVQGHTDVPLHGHGREQVAGTAARLADVSFHATYSSDLTRARESAEIIIASSNTGPHELCIDQSLREVSFGVFEGMTWNEIDNAYSPLRVHLGSRNLDYRPDGGESYRELLDRLGGFAESLKQRHADQDVLVVGHGAALRALVVRLLGLPYDAYWMLTGLGSASISKVRNRHGHTSLVAWNDVGHLPPRQQALPPG